MNHILHDAELSLRDKRIAELEAARSRYQLRIVDLEHALETIVERQDNVRTSDYCYNVAIKALRKEIT